MSVVTNVVGGARQAIGPYFSLVSVLPSTFLVLAVAFLITSGAWHQAPDWPLAARRLADTGFTGLAALAVLSVAVAAVMHPLQFRFVQFLEGYWGTGRISQWIRVLLIRRHRKRREALMQLAVHAGKALRHADEMAVDLDRSAADRLSADRAAINLASLRHEALRIVTDYPLEPRSVMPTGLGNVLRRYEMLAGRPYGLDAPTVVPYLAQIAPAEQVAYLDDRRSVLDLSVRTSLTSLAVLLATVVFLWDDGLWLLLALVPYAAAYAGYRGSIVCAHHYGQALSTLLVLNRFEMYERMHLPLPGSLALEARREEMMRKLLLEYDSPSEPVRFKHPAKPDQAG